MEDIVMLGRCSICRNTVARFHIWEHNGEIELLCRHCYCQMLVESACEPVSLSDDVERRLLFERWRSRRVHGIIEADGPGLAERVEAPA